MAGKAVQVVARLRPPLQEEDELCTFAGEPDYVDIVNFRNQDENLRYSFSRVFDESTSQDDVFAGTVEPLLDDLFHGYNASVLAYGPTGAGKTYTTLGTGSEPGIIPRAVTGLLEKMETRTDEKCRLVFSYLEIYNEKLIDLLVKDQSCDLAIREDGNRRIHVPGLTERPITCYDDFSHHFYPASKRRTVASTKLNEHSSRSHSIIMLKMTVHSGERQRGLVAKLYIIDLAGSENNKRTGNRGIRLKESGAINNSLFVLGQVVDALNNNVVRVPYRDSKLTRLLQDSFGGNAQAVVITNLAPELSHYMLTYTTLNFAQKTRQVVNRPLVNECTPLKPARYQPVCKAPRLVEVAEPDSSSLPTSISFTPLRESLLSPINHTRDDITNLNARMQKLESLLNTKAQEQSTQQDVKQTKTTEQIPVQRKNEGKEVENQKEYTDKGVETSDIAVEVEERNQSKENMSPPPVPLTKVRRKFDWGSPVTASPATASPLDSSALFVQKNKPIRRKPGRKPKSTAAKQTPARVKNVALPEFPATEATTITPNLKAEHNAEILRVLNEGNVKALCRLSTMGAKRSQAIIDHRTFVGPFNEILDICKVPAFSKAFVEKFLKTNYIDLS